MMAPSLNIVAHRQALLFKLSSLPSTFDRYVEFVALDR
jgi:hypothetical protein